MRVSFLLAALTALAVASVGCGKVKDGAQPSGSSDRGGEATFSAGKASLDLSYVPSDAIAVAVVHPTRVFKSPLIARVPAPQEEVAAMLSRGAEIDARKVDQVMLVITRPMKDAKGAKASTGSVWISRFSEKIEAKNVLSKVPGPFFALSKPRIEEATYQGKTYYRRVYGRDAELDVGIPIPADAAFFPDERTMVFAEEKRLQTVISAQGEEGPLVDRLRQTSADHDLLIVLSLEAIRQLASEDARDGKHRLTGELADIGTTIPEGLKYGTLTADLDGQTLVEVVLEARDAESAGKVEGLVRKALEAAQAKLAAMPRPISPDAPLGVATALQLADLALNSTEITTRSDQVAVRMKRPPGMDDLFPKLIAQSLARAKANAREYADRSRQWDKLHELAKAMHDYEGRRSRFPQPALRDKSSKPLLSWRVQILRELNQEALYKEFRLDEPWDSEHNKRLIERMPEVFRSASGGENGKTPFMLFVGPGTAFDGEKPVSLDGIMAKDGASKTIMIVEAGLDKTVVWTKPEDLRLDPTNPIAALGNVPARGFEAVFFDGHYETIDKDVSPTRLRRLVDPNDREPLDDEETSGKTRGTESDKKAAKAPGP